MAPGLVTPEKAARGKRPTDVWFHTIVPTNGREKTGYPTQKPEGVLRRIVAASSRPAAGAWIRSPGRARSARSAASSGRRFVLVDASPVAIEVMRDAARPAPASESARTSGTNADRARAAGASDRLRRSRRVPAIRCWCVGADRRDQPPADRELALERRRQRLARRGGDVDRVERRLLGQALVAVADRRT